MEHDQCGISNNGSRRMDQCNVRLTIIPPIYNGAPLGCGSSGMAVFDRSVFILSSPPGLVCARYILLQKSTRLLNLCMSNISYHVYYRDAVSYSKEGCETA